jgi:hypothetical protein
MVFPARLPVPPDPMRFQRRRAAWLVGESQDIAQSRDFLLRQLGLSVAE